MEPIDFLRQALENIVKDKIGDFQTELRNQGHVDTGNLLNSFHAQVIDTASGFSGEILSDADYGIFVDKGVQQARYPIDIMVSWVERRLGLSGVEARSVAYAIKAVHRKTGIPTPNAYSFSKNGFRTSFIKRAVAANENVFNERVEEALNKFAQMVAENVIFRISKELRQSAGIS